MPRDLAETVGKDVYYPDDLAGLSTIRLENPSEVWEPDEVPHDEAEFGLWMEADVGLDETKFICVPSQLRDAIHNADSDTLRVEKCEKGPRDHDEYDVEVTFDPEHH